MGALSKSGWLAAGILAIAWLNSRPDEPRLAPQPPANVVIPARPATSSKADKPITDRIESSGRSVAKSGTRSDAELKPSQHIERLYTTSCVRLRASP